jgi:hypothetical protein
MADAAVTYEVKGTSDVQEQTDKAKKSMSQMENAIEGLNKKMSNWGKDLILSYIAPMVLLNKAIDYISQSIEKQRQAVADALEFAKKGDSKELDPSTISLARKKASREQEIEDKKKAETARAAVTEDFLRNASDKDMERFYKRLGPGSRLMLTMATYESASKDKSVQNAVRDIENANMLREEEKKPKEQPGKFDSMSVQNAVFGMGTSPLIGAMNEQLEQQKRQTVLLERIADNTPSTAGDTDYTKAPPYYKPSSVMNRAP